MRPSVILTSMGMLAACGGLLYLHATREGSESTLSSATTQRVGADRVPGAGAAEAAIAEPDVSNQSPHTTVTPGSSDATDVTTADARPAPANVEQWIKETQDIDPKTRAAAIAKLADAPTAQALPALREVVDHGEPEVDRHIALRSLHALALRDGDGNSEIRDVMRRAIYHSDNDGVTQTAQSLLDDVEAALAEQQSAAN